MPAHKVPCVSALLHHPCLSHPRPGSHDAKCMLCCAVAPGLFVPAGTLHQVPTLTVWSRDKLASSVPSQLHASPSTAPRCARYTFTNSMPSCSSGAMWLDISEGRECIDRETSALRTSLANTWLSRCDVGTGKHEDNRVQ